MNEAKGDLLILARQESARELNRVYLNLSEGERDRVWNFIADALERSTDLEAEEDWRAIEAFWIFIQHFNSGESESNTCKLLDLSPLQYERYARAMLAVRGVHEEVTEACAVLFDFH